MQSQIASRPRSGSHEAPRIRVVSPRKITRTSMPPVALALDDGGKVAEAISRARASSTPIANLRPRRAASA
jgi:hypothetical protein